MPLVIRTRIMKKPGGVLAEEESAPLQPFQVRFGNDFPALLGERRDISDDVQAVFFRFERLDLVHGPSSSFFTRTAAAFSSGCLETGSQAFRVRLLAHL